MTGAKTEGQQPMPSDFQTILANLESERNRFSSYSQSPVVSSRIGSSFDSASRRMTYGQQTPGVLRAEPGDRTFDAARDMTGANSSRPRALDANTSDVLSELERVRSGIHASLAAAGGSKSGERTNDDLSSLWKKYQMKY